MPTTSAARDFSRSTLRRLAARGVEIIGRESVPAHDGDAYFSGVAYVVAIDDRAVVRTFLDVIALADADA